MRLWYAGKVPSRLGAVVADGTQVREVSELDEFVCQVDGQKSEALQLFAAFEMVFILSTGNLYPPWHHSMYLVRSRRANTCRVRRGRLQLLGLVHQCVVGQVPTFGDALLMQTLWLLNATKVLICRRRNLRRSRPTTTTPCMQGERLEVVKTFKDGVSLREVMASASPKSAPGAAATINAGTCYSRHFRALSVRDMVHASSLSYNHHSPAVRVATVQFRIAAQSCKSRRASPSRLFTEGRCLVQHRSIGIPPGNGGACSAASVCVHRWLLIDTGLTRASSGWGQEFFDDHRANVRVTARELQ